jgi:hypothetical protein
MQIFMIRRAKMVGKDFVGIDDEEMEYQALCRKSISENVSHQTHLPEIKPRHEAVEVQEDNEDIDDDDEMEDSSENAGSGGLKEQVAQKTGSILRRNPGGVVMSIIISIPIFISMPSVTGFILTPVLAFVGYLIGNKLRLALHPDFVMASGFMGLLKEKIFWMFIPQLIGTVIGAAIGAGIGMALF